MWLRAKAIDANGSRDVLQRVLADILEGRTDLSRRVFLHALRHAYPARLGDPFEARRDVDAVAKDVAVLFDDVAEIDADPEIQPLIRAHVRIAPSHSLLHLDGAAHRIDDAGELGQQPVARRLDDPAAMLGDAGIEQFAAMAVKAGKGAFVVGAHQPTVAGDVSRKDRRELSLDAVGLHPISSRARGQYQISDPKAASKPESPRTAPPICVPKA